MSNWIGATLEVGPDVHPGLTKFWLAALSMWARTSQVLAGGAVDVGEDLSVADSKMDGGCLGWLGCGGEGRSRVSRGAAPYSSPDWVFGAAWRSPDWVFGAAWRSRNPGGCCGQSRLR
ncbi:hypothetical protein QE152_g22245 [Popillia japonica]|uniref:Uncharacterized protein n=1 Tax=Popillia japonica TaxID=7064 RepID=A0AAW1KJC0_POPJA